MLFFVSYTNILVIPTRLRYRSLWHQEGTMVDGGAPGVKGAFDDFFMLFL